MFCLIILKIIMEGASPKKPSWLPLIQTTTFTPAVRIVLAVIAILAGVYFAVGFVVTGMVFVALFSAFRNLFAIDAFSALVSIVTYVGPVFFYLALCVMSCIFAKLLLKKQPISGKLLIAYIGLIVLSVVFERLLMLALQLVSMRVGA